MPYVIRYECPIKKQKTHRTKPFPTKKAAQKWAAYFFHSSFKPHEKLVPYTIIKVPTKRKR